MQQIAAYAAGGDQAISEGFKARPRESADWLRGLDLRERLELSRRSPLYKGDDAKARRKMRAWRDIPALRSASGFATLLKAFDTTEPEFLRALSIDAEHPDLSWEVPTWATEIIDIYADETPPNISSSCLAADFFAFIAPLSAIYRSRFVRGLNGLNATCHGQISNNAPSLADMLDEQLLRVVAGPLILEINVARVSGQLEGASAQERYESFLRMLEMPAFRLQLWRQYPGMARHAVRLCSQWLNASLEFASRFIHDSELLSKALGTKDCILEDACFLGAESHHEGRRVIAATLADGNRIVYKARPLSATKHFQDLVCWLNSVGQSPALRPLMVIDRGPYGWMEYVSAGRCESAAAVRRFYRRQGALLALTYLIGATDCHFENVVACGEHPIIVDLETLFQPRLVANDATAPADDVARAALLDSVLSSGLLPTPSIVNGQIVDLSGLGARSFQDTPLDALGVVDARTDAVRVERVPYRLGRVENRPMYGTLEPSIHVHVDDIVLGFNRAYALLLKRRADLATTGGPTERFLEDPIRVLLRPTAIYARVLSEALHPNALYDSNVRDQVLLALWKTGERAPFGTACCLAEYEEMCLGDVPFFKSTPSSDQIYSCKDSVAFNVAVTGTTLAERRLGRMGDVDQKLQVSFIRASVDALQRNQRNGRPRQIRAASKHEGELTTARRIGEYLEETAFVAGSSATWLSPRPSDTEAKNGLPVGVVPTTLYDGLAGIAMFLAYLAECTTESRFRDLSRSALSTIDDRLLHELPMLGVGAFDGLAGLLYVYAHLGMLWGDRRLLQRAEGLLDELGRRIRRGDIGFDLISGAAGAILALVALNSMLPDSDALKRATQCADYLDAEFSVMQQPDGATILHYERGASHGYAGVALALAALAAFTDRPDWPLLRFMMQYEVELTRDGHWMDPNDPERSTQATWCHGAPGIAMCRIGAFQYMKDERQLAAIYDALLEAERCPAIPTTNLGLCHGELGVIDSLLIASQLLDDSARWYDAAATRLNAHLSAFAPTRRKPWRHLIHSPGLMTGIAGTGYGLLRFAEPEIVPSVLLLEPPKRML